MQFVKQIIIIQLARIYGGLAPKCITIKSSNPNKNSGNMMLIHLIYSHLKV